MSKVNEKNFALIQGWMLTQLGLKGNELLIYAIIYGFSQAESQRFTGSLQYLSEWTGATKQTVINNLKSLVEKGYIGREEKIINGVKIIEYYSKNFNGGSQKILMGGSQKILPNNIDINNISIKKECSFDLFWKEYPRHVAKPRAKAAYEKAIRSGATDEQIIEGLLNVKAKQWDKWTDEEKKFIPHPATWLNQGRWADEVEERKTKKTIPDYMAEDYEETTEVVEGDYLSSIEEMKRMMKK